MKELDSTRLNIHHDLVEGCRRGDRAAQFRIYKLYYKAMYNTTVRIVNNSAEAEDIMQESFLDAFRRISTYTGDGSFGSWLKRIVVNNALDSLRRSKDLVPLDEEVMEMPVYTDDYSEAEIEMQVNEIKEAIMLLPDDYRVIISLFLLEGYDHEEISEILNISNQLSRTRYSRARQKLLVLLHERKMKSEYRYN